MTTAGLSGWMGLRGRMGLRGSGWDCSARQRAGGRLAVNRFSTLRGARSTAPGAFELNGQGNFSPGKIGMLVIACQLASRVGFASGQASRAG